MSDTPWYAWYVGDARAKMRRLNLRQKGAYRELLDEIYATREPLPGAMDELYLIAGALDEDDRAAVRFVIGRFFVVDDAGMYHNRRADREMTKQRQFRDMQSEKGTLGAAAKWGSENPNKANRSERLAAARLKGTHTVEEWLSMVDIFDGKCLKCKVEGVVKDHIIPVYQEGSDSIQNLQPLCRSCNAAKGPENKDLRTEGWEKRLAERLAERLLNACLTPGLPQPQPHTTATTTSTDHKPPPETKKSKVKSVTHPTDAFPRPPEVPAQVWDDLLKCRVKKRLANTETAWKGLMREFKKAGLTVLEGVTISAERGWGGFRASWDWQDESKRKGRTAGNEAAMDEFERRVIEREAGGPFSDVE